MEQMNIFVNESSPAQLGWGSGMPKIWDSEIAS